MDTLEKGTTAKEKWEGIKTTKANFAPQFSKMKDIHGNRVPFGEQGRAKAEYLAEIQWKPINNPPPPKQNPRKIIRTNLNMKEDEITMTEIKAAIKRFKNNKAPGPDKVTAEMFKYMHTYTLEILQSMLNECWRTATIPEIMTEAM